MFSLLIKVGDYFIHEDLRYSLRIETIKDPRPIKAKLHRKVTMV